MIISMKGNQNHCISNDTSSLSCMIQLNPPQDQGKIHGEYHHQPQQETGSINQPVLDQANSSCNQHIGKEQAQGSPKWMSSKMRLMRKMLGTTDQIHLHKQRRSQSLQDQASSSNSPSDIFRVCSNCKTTKTPLWRSGPQGPKSLCNACGIRQMKARRAMRAAAAAAAGLSSGFVPAATNCKTVQQEERIRSDVDRTIPFKKRFKIVASASAQKKLRFDEVTVSLSNKPPFHQTFPQEEKDAAILLMALSCGLIHG